ncbi:MAG: hypothetical protein ACOZFS_06240 [Thermodesulfobacteriota bacterium]
MTRKWLAIATVVCFAVSLVGCATETGYYDPYRSAGAGALGGAATGAAIGSIIGAATGSAATGAWVGAAAGGVLGGVGAALYASHRNSEIRSSRAAAQAYNYQGQGNVVSIDSVSASPSTVRPGQQVNLGMTYTILTPSNAPVSVNLSREIRYNGQMVGSPYQTTVSNANGTYNDSVSYALPSNASPGNYTVTSRVMSSYGTSQRDAMFTVQ